MGHSGNHCIRISLTVHKSLSIYGNGIFMFSFNIDKSLLFEF